MQICDHGARQGRAGNAGPVAMVVENIMNVCMAGVFVGMQGELRPSNAKQKCSGGITSACAAHATAWTTVLSSAQATKAPLWGLEHFPRFWP
jgi:hypothetical protein